jgi:coenzyme F420-0:L-glutamate ligase/coenzyme F420-1:gamma-L-glutamate ligase
LIKIMPIKILADIKVGDSLGKIITETIRQAREDILEGDILVVAQKIVSKAEGRVVDLDRVKPSRKAMKLATTLGKDPRVVEIILRESSEVIKVKKGIIISETKHGFVCANAGVDQSNVQGHDHVLLLPTDPDKSAARIRREVRERTGVRVAVVVTDTFGRPFRLGQTNVAVGIAGIKPIRSYIGTRDMYGKMLRVTEIAVADEIASAAELAMGKIERVPVVVVRGYGFEKTARSSIKQLARPRRLDLFR